MLEVRADGSAAGEWAWEPQTESTVFPVLVGFAAREALSDPRVLNYQTWAVSTCKRLSIYTLELTKKGGTAEINPRPFKGGGYYFEVW